MGCHRWVFIHTRRVIDGRDCVRMGTGVCRDTGGHVRGHREAQMVTYGYELGTRR